MRLRPGAILCLVLMLGAVAVCGLMWQARKPRVQAALPPSETPCLDLNQASERELATLPGVGPSLAKRIVDLRMQRGRFNHVHELLDVKGVGKKKLARIRLRVKLNIQE